MLLFSFYFAEPTSRGQNETSDWIFFHLPELFPPLLLCLLFPYDEATIKYVYFTFFSLCFTLEPELAFLRSRMICFVSLFSVSHFFYPLSINSLAFCPASIPPNSSLTFSVSSSHSQILNYAPMGDVCNST